MIFPLSRENRIATIMMASNRSQEGPEITLNGEVNPEIALFLV
jgi:hypothetical protein